MNKKLLPFIIGLTLAPISSLVNADDLNDIYQLALNKDPQVLRAAAIVNVRKEGIVQAKSVLFPQLSLRTGVTYNDNSFTTKADGTGAGDYIPVDRSSISNSYTFSLTQEIFNLSTWSQLDISKKQALQSELSHKLAKQNLISRVSQLYFDVLKAQDDLEFAEAENKAIERQLEQTNQRFKVGLTAITDVHEAQAQFDNSVATVIRSENNVEIQKELLREITGQYHQELSPLNTARFSTAKLDSSKNNWVNLAQSNNQELHIETINMQIAQENIENAHYGHLPTVNLSSDWGRSNSNREKLAIAGIEIPDENPPRSESKSIGITLSVPIFSGFRTESGIKEAQANYVASSEDRELAHRRIVRTIRTSYSNVATLISTIKALQQAVVSAESALKATEAGFEVGTRTIVDVLDSTQSLFSAKRNLASSRYDYIMAVLNLKLAAGTVSDTDVKAINKGLGK